MSNIDDSGPDKMDQAVTEGKDAQQLYPSSDHSEPGATQNANAPLPRPERKPRRAKADRGLPPDEDLAKLALAYLERQRKLWPEIAQAKLLPDPTDVDAINIIVNDFKERHRGGKVEVESFCAFTKFCAKFGGNYNRFSCDNSSPLSITDQMVNCLDRARSENRFVPWALVYADFSVTGLDPDRQGYSSYKAILANKDLPIDTTYVDDFTRASRDELEWWKLAHMSRRLGKRLVGATDHFDVNDPQWDVWLTVYGLFSRMFIKGLREKTRRGMKGAARRGTCLGKLPLGFTRQVCQDANGKIEYRPDGRPRHQPCIDPATKQFRVEMYELFVHKNWSPYRIARHFNQLKVDGSNGWTGTSIKNLLAGIDAIGVFVWNRERREYDYEEEKYVTIQIPKSEWVIHKAPELALVPKELWRAAWLKLLKIRKEHPLTGKKQSRNQVSATTLFSGTLFCEYCERELLLLRSTKKYKVMACLSGSTGVHDCLLTTSKSVQIIEDCLLGFINKRLLIPETVEDLVKRANVYLEELARKPQVNTMPMKKKARDYQERIKKLVRKVEKEPDETLCDEYHSRIKELQKEVNDLKVTIREAESHNQKPPEPLDVQRAQVFLTDLRELLNQEIPMAAEAIRALTGPITIREEKIPGKRGARWIATFSPDVLALLRKVAKNNGYADFPALAITPVDKKSVEVVIDKVPKYELLAPLFRQMRDNGACIQTIATAYQISREYASQILEFANTGKRPDWGPSKQCTGRGITTKYKDIAPEVARMRDVEKMPFTEIAKQLKVSKETVGRAYDHAHPESCARPQKRAKCRSEGNILASARKSMP